MMIKFIFLIVQSQIKEMAFQQSNLNFVIQNNQNYQKASIKIAKYKKSNFPFFTLNQNPTFEIKPFLLQKGKIIIQYQFVVYIFLEITPFISIKMNKKPEKKFSPHQIANDNDSYQKYKTKPISQSETSKFNKFQIVWAKITGYPWWPAIITTVPNEKDNSHIEDDFKNGRYFSQMNGNSSKGYRVDFIADQTHAYLKKNFLLKYSQNRNRLCAEGLEFFRRKRQYFQMAINQADQLIQVIEISKNQVNKNPQAQGQEESQSSSNQQSSSQQSQNSSACEQQENESQKPEINFFKQSFPIKKQTIKYSRLAINKDKTIQNEAKEDETGIFTAIKRKRGRPAKKIRNNLHNLHVKKTRLSLRSLAQNDIYEEQMDVEEQKQQQRVDIIQKESEQQKEQQKSVPEEAKVKLVRKRTRVFQNGRNKIQDQEQVQQKMSQILKKYKLDKIDEIQQEYKLKSIETSNIQDLQVLNNSNAVENKKIKGSRSVTFIKNVLSLAGQKKHFKKNYFGNNRSNCQKSIFTENFVALSKLKGSENQKISDQKQKMLIQYSKKWTSRKAYMILESILNKAKLFPTNQDVLNQIKERCIDISRQMFSEGQFQINANFISLLKSKIQKSIKFLKLFSLQNWNMMIKTGDFSAQLCILVKSLQQFLHRQCGLILKDESKYSDIIKQIQIQNQKTAFIYGHNPNELMENQNDSANPIDPRSDRQKYNLFAYLRAQKIELLSRNDLKKMEKGRLSFLDTKPKI